MRLSHISVSETGRRRTNNEDAVLYVQPDKPWLTQSMGILAIVSDGMGGYQRGEKASALVVDVLSRAYYRDVGQPLEKLRIAAIEANNAVSIESKISVQRMGATCTGVVVCKDQVHFVHIGDSRAYIYSDNLLKQYTTDHTAANELAQSRPMRHSDQTLIYNPHALTKAMGMNFSNECQADVFSIQNNLQKGDRILLCSDGLYLHVSDHEIHSVFQQKKSLKETTDQLVKWVMKRGAQDNFTFLIIEVN